MSATCAFSIATCVPAAPIAMPTSETARAAASLMPSPTIATVPFTFNAFTASTLSWGKSSAWMLVMPICFPTASATRRWSPREDDHLDTHPLHFLHRPLRLCTWRICYPEDANELPADSKVAHRVRLRLHVLHLLLQLWRGGWHGRGRRATDRVVNHFRPNHASASIDHLCHPTHLVRKPAAAHLYPVALD